jgi:hypothetical protein
MKWENLTDEKNLRYLLRNDTGIELVFEKNKSYYEGECVIGDRPYSIVRKGFWKTHIDLVGDDGKPIASLLLEKWYSRKWRLQIDDHNYYIKYQNNPMFELIVEDYSSETLIKYKLLADEEETGAELEILTEPAAGEGHLNIMILMAWYIILPICVENTADLAH